MAKVEAKVAKILDEYRVALNKGSGDGVVRGASATLWRIVEIPDPDTQEILDTIRLDAAKFEIVGVTPTVSIAAIPQSSGLAIFGFARPSRRITTSGASTDEVRVSVGDEVTVQVSDTTTG